MRLFGRPLATVGAGLAAVAVVTAAIAPPAAAAPITYTRTSSPVLAAAGWLATQFVDKTHLPAPGGDHFDSKSGGTYYPNYGENADVIFGLAAAKAARPKIDTALRYLAANVDAYVDLSKSQGGPYDGSIGKLALAAQVAGADPRNVAGHDLLALLKQDECTAPSTPPSTSCVAAGAAQNIFASAGESFVILAEARAGGAFAPSPAALGYLTTLQCANGGFTTNPTPCGTGAADLDATSYAIMALAAAGGHAAQIDKAVAWLKGQQHPGGYWVSQNVPNANSTGLAVAALASQGVDVSAARTWLRGQQVGAGRAGAGAIKYAGTVTATTTSATSPSVIATAQALTGLVDGGSLATLTGTGTSDSIPMFAPGVALSAAGVRGGAKLTVTGAGFVPGEKLTVQIHSAPVTLGSGTAGPLGTARVAVTVPATLPAGAHAVVITGDTSQLSATRAIAVAAAPSSSAAASATATATATAAAGPVAPDPGAPALAATGRDGRQLAALAAIGLAALVLGAALAFLGRRRVRR